MRTTFLVADMFSLMSCLVCVLVAEGMLGIRLMIMVMSKTAMSGTDSATATVESLTLIDSSISWPGRVVTWLAPAIARVSRLLRPSTRPHSPGQRERLQLQPSDFGCDRDKRVWEGGGHMCSILFAHAVWSIVDSQNYVSMPKQKCGVPRKPTIAPFYASFPRCCCARLLRLR